MTSMLVGDDTGVTKAAEQAIAIVITNPCGETRRACAASKRGDVALRVHAGADHFTARRVFVALWTKSDLPAVGRCATNGCCAQVAA
jgi:hypothetical protein